MIENTKKPISALILKILFFVGVILAIGILAFTMARYIPKVVSSISTASASLFRTFIPAEKLTVESSKNTLQSGERFTLTWPLTPDTMQDHTLTYACKSDVTVYYIGGSNTKIPVKCNEEFKLGKSGSATIEINLKKDNYYTDVDFTIIQKTEDVKDRRGAKTITVTSGNATLEDISTVSTSTKPTLTSETKPVTKPAPTPKTGGNYYAPAQPVYTGPADLIVSKPIYLANINAINFTVTNAGGTYTGPWSLSATLPTQEKLFTSVDQASLAPGASVLFTLRLGTIQRNGNYSIVVVADNRNMVSESNESNNTGETTISITSGSNSGSNSGKADLIVKILRTQYVNGNDIGVTFQIQNIGGKTAKDWKFNATLPTRNEDDEDFESREQPDLGPGDTLEYTLGFDDPRSNGYIEIEVDEEDEVDESNENNNDVRMRITN